MPNEGDLGNKAADLFLEAALENSKRVTGNEKLTGSCQWCGEPTRGAYCSAECRTDDVKQKRMKR